MQAQKLQTLHAGTGWDGLRCTIRTEADAIYSSGGAIQALHMIDLYIAFSVHAQLP